MAKTDSAKPGQLDWFLHLLKHLGWAGTEGRRAQTVGKARGALAGARCCPLLLPGGAPLLVVALDVPLPRAARAFEAFEDLLPEHRRAAAHLAAEGFASRHLVLLGRAGEAHFIDLEAEEVLAATDGREGTAAQVLPYFDAGALMRGSMAQLPHKAPSRRALELQRWCRLWSTRLGAAANAPREAVELFFEWTLLARLAQDTHGPGTEKARFADFALEGRRPAPKRFLQVLFARLGAEWNLLQGDAADDARKFLRAAEEPLLLEFLEHFALVGRSKFAADIFGEAFADEELRTLSWRENLLAAEQPPPEPAAALAPARVELDREGFALMLRRYDQLVTALRAQRNGLQAQRARGTVAGLQLDAFGVDPPVEAPEERLPAFALAELLRVTTREPRREALARSVLLARAVEWTRQLDAQPNPLPRLAGAAVLLERPAPADPAAALRRAVDAAGNN
ncbi:MAG: hypothetical protein SF028_14340 [Candidatus Sumerlaeia bacterium]|nr:hypothetical protein [Candidatus Sumerlaeia bacterium]